MQDKKVLLIIPKTKQSEQIHDIVNKINTNIDVIHDEKIGYEALKSGSYDLVISQMFSSQMNGYELVSKIKKDNINCGVILIMGDCKDKIKREMVEKGVFSFVKKCQTDIDLPRHITDYFKYKSGFLTDRDKILEDESYALEEKVFNLEQKLLNKSEELALLKKKTREITNEYKETKRNLEKNQEYLINSERMITVGQMTASIIHEINNPLTIITSLAGLVSLECKDNPKISKYNNTLADNIEKLRKLTFTVLSFVNPRRMENDEDVDVNSTISELIEFYDCEIMKNGITLVKSFGDDLPHVKISKVKFQQVILNIVKNSIYAVKKSYGNVTITTFLKDGYVNIEIKDNGKGIKKSDLPNIFLPFFTTKSKDDGNGLGLYICKQIIEKYNGSIDAKSTLRKGTTITVKLPIKKSKSKKRTSE